MAAKLKRTTESDEIDVTQIGQEPVTGPVTAVETTVEAGPVEAASETPVPPVAVVTHVASLLACEIHVNILPPGTQLTGYMATMSSASFDLPPHLKDRFRRFVAGLHQSHATYPGVGGKRMHVDSAADAMKWLISQLPE